MPFFINAEISDYKFEYSVKTVRHDNKKGAPLIRRTFSHYTIVSIF